VVFVHHIRTRQCADTVRWVGLDGQSHGVMLSGYGQIGAVGLSTDGRAIAFESTPCRTSGESLVRVVDVRTGEVTMRISNPPLVYGPIAVASLAVTRHYLVMVFGSHLNTWLAKVRLATPVGYTVPSLVRGDLTPRGCQVMNAVPQSLRVVTGVITCRGGQHVYRLSGSTLSHWQRGPVLPARLGHVVVGAATPGGVLIGSASRSGRELIVQIRGRTMRLLPSCPSPHDRSQCRYDPVWA